MNLLLFLAHSCIFLVKDLILNASEKRPHENECHTGAPKRFNFGDVSKRAEEINEMADGRLRFRSINFL
jgi:hypothetical protein